MYVYIYIFIYIYLFIYLVYTEHKPEPDPKLTYFFCTPTSIPLLKNLACIYVITPASTELSTTLLLTGNPLHILEPMVWASHGKA